MDAPLFHLNNFVCNDFVSNEGILCSVNGKSDVLYVVKSL